MRVKYEVCRGGEVESVEEWEKFRDMVMKCTNEVCGMRRVGEQRRKGSEWWNELGRAVAEKRRAFEEWLLPLWFGGLEFSQRLPLCVS